MEILFSVLLGTLLFVESAHCRQCYMCAKVNDFSLCKVKKCNDGENTCTKTVVTSDVGFKMKSYSLDCTSSCEDYKNVFLKTPSHGFKVDVSCCNTDLCNGVGGVRSNPWALTGAFLLSLGPALLWVGL
ncbi:lymphocyte antigen 6H-like [Antechinus flavipes]|uniref:lymphocyte antigen 6H-like n=1 Tax=Antechinus flavipes TaxID=38775 RepID=UPI002235C3B2|nr:lymphocyte antigen 6H-like [Antechinus flavipes]